MRDTPSTTGRNTRSTRHTSYDWQEVLTPWSEVADSPSKARTALVLVAIGGATWFDNRVGFVAWMIAFAAVYFFACFERWRHLRNSGDAAETRTTPAPRTRRDQPRGEPKPPDKAR